MNSCSSKLKGAKKCFQIILLFELYEISFVLPYFCHIQIHTIFQKQSSRGVLSKRRLENMQQIYRRTHMLKCDFNKVALQLYWNHTSEWMFSCKFAAYLQNTFYTINISGWLLLIFSAAFFLSNNIAINLFFIQYSARIG